MAQDTSTAELMVQLLEHEKIKENDKLAHVEGKQRYLKKKQAVLRKKRHNAKHALKRLDAMLELAQKVLDQGIEGGNDGGMGNEDVENTAQDSEEDSEDVEEKKRKKSRSKAAVALKKVSTQPQTAISKRKATQHSDEDHEPVARRNTRSTVANAANRPVRNIPKKSYADIKGSDEEGTNTKVMDYGSEFDGEGVEMGSDQELPKDALQKTRPKRGLNKDSGESVNKKQKSLESRHA